MVQPRSGGGNVARRWADGCLAGGRPLAWAVKRPGSVAAGASPPKNEERDVQPRSGGGNVARRWADGCLFGGSPLGLVAASSCQSPTPPPLRG
jgi:hypothetical protein